MFIFNLKIAFRRFYATLTHSLINVLGLSVGLTAFILIVLWVNHELSYDNFHHRKGELYRSYGVGVQKNGEPLKFYNSPAAMGLLYKEYFSGVEDFVRISRHWDEHLKYNENVIKTNLAIGADANFFDIFGYKLLEGKPADVLRDKKSIVLTASLAKKLFGDESAIGKSITLQFEKEYLVTGIVEDCPKNSLYQFEYVRLFPEPKASPNWDDWNYVTYFLISARSVITEIENRTAEFYMKKRPDYNTEETKRFFEENQFKGELVAIEDDYHYNKGKTELYTFLLIGFFILILALINFINLSTSQSSLRTKEVGLRRVLGGEPNDLRKQFLLESIMITWVSGLLSLTFLEVLRPFFNDWMGMEVNVYTFEAQWFWLFFVILLIVVGLVSGSYPAFYLSRLKPVETLKGEIRSNQGKPFLRNALVVFQFSVALCLIIATGVVYSQLTFMESKSLGFSKKHTIHIPFQNKNDYQKLESVKARLKNISGVETVGGVSSVPYGLGNSESFKVAKDMEREEGTFNAKGWYTEPEFLAIYDMNLVAGRGFDEKLKSDRTKCLINETFIRKKGWTLTEAIGQKVYRHQDYNQELEVIGVVKDFNFDQLSEEIGELIIMQRQDDAFRYYAYQYLAVKISSSTFSETLKQVERTWETVFPEAVFDVRITEQDMNTRYQGQQLLLKLFSAFSVLAILIALLGLFSLSAFKAQRKTKEIGIRKVFGAEMFDVLQTMMHDFTRMILVASVFASLTAYFTLSLWLESFAYHVDFNFWFIPMAIGLGLLTSWLTVLYHSLKVVRQDPVKALRYE